MLSYLRFRNWRYCCATPVTYALTWSTLYPSSGPSSAHFRVSRSLHRALIGFSTFISSGFSGRPIDAYFAPAIFTSAISRSIDVRHIMFSGGTVTSFACTRVTFTCPSPEGAAPPAAGVAAAPGAAAAAGTSAYTYSGSSSLNAPMSSLA